MTHLRVAILVLVRRSDSFASDTGWTEIKSSLEGHGHAVSAARSVSDGVEDLRAWRLRVSNYVRDGDFDLVALTRAWEPEILAEIRGAMRPDARLVRLSASGTGPLDGHFDHVVDGEGLLALADGATSVEAARWHPQTKKELRQRAPIAPELAWDALASLDPERSGPMIRPSLRGPAQGCPFLVDARTQPIFADLAVDASKVQMRGCTFCLDNSGAYAMPSVAQVLETWLAQLRELRRKQPGFREILLMDERPHPYLPALFEALLREPELAPIDLMFKSRVDWLLEFADTELARAAELAAQSGSVLYLYLVGFESFDQFHLDLFNKAVTVDDNVRAIAKIRELGARFPKSFEYRRYRCHGIVLFTPWTEPESLLTNARFMREVDFAELRSDSLRTRLRLYPRVPLHALAERDGLLAEAFSESFPDRAAEQGYDASVPWRFRDARTEAAFHAANALRVQGRPLSDADALEMAARFVLRHPGIGKAPMRAVNAITTGLRAWSLERVRPEEKRGVAVLSGFDLEIEGLIAGRREASLKEQVPVREAGELIEAYEAMGLRAEVVHAYGVADDGERHVTGETHALLAVARTPQTLAELVALQRQLRQKRDPKVIKAAGRLLGYPACCTAVHAHRQDPGDNLENERLPFRKANGARLHPLLNRLNLSSLLSHHLCSVDCAGSLPIAETNLGILEEHDPAAAAWFRERLGATVLFLDFNRRLELAGAFDGDRFVVQRATSIQGQFSIAPESIAVIRLAPREVRFELRDGRSQTLSAFAPMIVTPGAPLHGMTTAALAGATQNQTSASASSSGQSRAVLEPEAFRARYLARAELPIPLVRGWSMVSVVHSGQRPNGLDLVLEREGAPRLLVYAEQRQGGGACFVTTALLALSHYALPEGFPVGELRPAIEGLRDYLVREEQAPPS